MFRCLLKGSVIKVIESFKTLKLYRLPIVWHSKKLGPTAFSPHYLQLLNRFSKKMFFFFVENSKGTLFEYQWH